MIQKRKRPAPEEPALNKYNKVTPVYEKPITILLRELNNCIRTRSIAAEVQVTTNTDFNSIGTRDWETKHVVESREGEELRHLTQRPELPGLHREDVGRLRRAVAVLDDADLAIGSRKHQRLERDFNFLVNLCSNHLVLTLAGEVLNQRLVGPRVNEDHVRVTRLGALGSELVRSIDQAILNAL